MDRQHSLLFLPGRSSHNNTGKGCKDKKPEVMFLAASQLAVTSCLELCLGSSMYSAGETRSWYGGVGIEQVGIEELLGSFLFTN